VSLSFTPGSYNVGLWLFENLIPDSSFDEFGTTGGTPAPGERWQIDVPDYAIVGDPNTSATGTIIANTIANTLSDKNDVPGGVDSITGICANLTPSPNCNDYTSFALSQSFTVNPGDVGTLTFDVSPTKPASGFYLEQIDPAVVTGGPPATEYYTESFSETSTVCTVNCGGGSPVPEPSSWISLLAFAGVLVFAVRRRSAAA
jgi:hypothetical protein